MIIFIILTIVVIAVLHIATKPDDVVGWGLWLVMAVGMMLITLLAGFVCSSHAATNTTVYSSDRYDTTITKNERYWYFDKDHKFTSSKKVLVYDKQAHKVLEKGRLEQ